MGPGSMLTCHVVNLQPHLGGAEVYTMSFARAVKAAGCRVVLHVKPSADFWAHLASEGIELSRVSIDAGLPDSLPGGSWIVTQAPVSEGFVARAVARHWLTGFCHMPLAGRRAGLLARYHLVYAVSAYVASTMDGAGLRSRYPEPLYGIAEFSRGQEAEPQPVLARSPYAWDRRKWRDRAMSMLAPFAALAARQRVFAPRPGCVVLGIVSNIGPIKQFDILFRLIAPIIAARPEVTLEIFGSGGYRSVANLKEALAPLGERARFWGEQPRPTDIYPQLDFLMSGLPEKEALGLNILEAQVQGVPVLAVDAPPFSETVCDGVTGYLYPDPRTDQGAGFRRVFERALAQPAPDRGAAGRHLEKFSRASFERRIARLVDDAAAHVRRAVMPGYGTPSKPAVEC
jgi:glycosyltransferase involved in cell wall biosynthesis